MPKTPTKEMRNSKMKKIASLKEMIVKLSASVEQNA